MELTFDHTIELPEGATISVRLEAPSLTPLTWHQRALILSLMKDCWRYREQERRWPPDAP